MPQVHELEASQIDTNISSPHLMVVVSLVEHNDHLNEPFCSRRLAAL